MASGNKIKKAVWGDPIEEDLEFVINDTLEFEIEGYNDDGTDYDWTGHSFHMMVKEDREDDTADAILDILDADFSVSGNLVTVSHDASNTGIIPKVYFYDIELTYPSGKVQTIYEGNIEFTQDTTR